MKLTIEIDDELMARIREFKKIYDSIMGEDADFNDYASLLINFGLEKMLRDVVPEGQEWMTIQYIFVERPKVLSELISGVWKETGEERKKMEENMKKKIERYIG